MKMTNEFSLGPLMTFDSSKELPIHRWFWYKEGFSPQLVKWALDREVGMGSGAPERLLDPFCGVGTSLLAAKEKLIPSLGVDASDLAVFIAKAKTMNYSAHDVEAAKEFAASVFSEGRPPEREEWEFELFDIRKAFPKRNINDIIFLRERIETLDPGPRNLLLLALLSVLPQCSMVIKDGGVLKIAKEKSAMPAKDAFRRKVKAMVADIEATRANPIGPEPDVFLGDARATGFPEQSVGIIVTSPPYLNNIDYSKVYGLELSLLAMSKAAAEEVRLRSVRSFIGRKMQVRKMPPEVGEIGERIPIVGTYFADMEAAIAEMRRVLVPGGAAYVNVSNSVIHETHVLVDEVFAEMALRLGFTEAEIVVGAERIADVRPQKVKTRESVVIMRR